MFQGEVNAQIFECCIHELIDLSIQFSNGNGPFYFYVKTITEFGNE